MQRIRAMRKGLIVAIAFCALYLRGSVIAQGAASAQGAAPATAAAAKVRVSQEVQLTGDQLWSDTGIDVRPGEHIVVHATGKLRYADAKEDNGPDGIARGFKDLLRILPFNGGGRGELIGRVGDPDIAQPFLLGADKDVVAPTGGRLFLGLNETTDDLGDGTYTVRIEIHPPDASFKYHAAREVKSLPGIDARLFAKIPRRVSDKAGNPGDMVNFLIIGSESRMQDAFTNAGWVKVDADVRDTVLHGLIVSISKESYLTMPMSQLYLFDRPQDYGWAHAEPIRVVASRNHLRVWKAPFDVHGRTLWVGAATHDIGFEQDRRNGSVTHKIDPDVDVERDYVKNTFLVTGLVSEFAYFQPTDALKEAKTATGGSFHSNGGILVLELADTDAGH